MASLAFRFHKISISTRALPWTLLEELTMLQRLSNWLRRGILLPILHPAASRLIAFSPEVAPNQITVESYAVTSNVSLTILGQQQLTHQTVTNSCSMPVNKKFYSDWTHTQQQLNLQVDNKPRDWAMMRCVSLRQSQDKTHKYQGWTNTEIRKTMSQGKTSALTFHDCKTLTGKQDINYQHLFQFSTTELSHNLKQIKQWSTVNIRKLFFSQRVIGCNENGQILATLARCKRLLCFFSYHAQVQLKQKQI